MVSVDVKHHEGRKKFFLSCFMLSDRREGKLVRGCMRGWRRGVEEEGEGGKEEMEACSRDGRAQLRCRAQ